MSLSIVGDLSKLIPVLTYVSSEHVWNVEFHLYMMQELCIVKRVTKDITVIYTVGRREIVCGCFSLK